MRCDNRQSYRLTQFHGRIFSLITIKVYRYIMLLPFICYCHKILYLVWFHLLIDVTLMIVFNLANVIYYTLILILINGLLYLYLLMACWTSIHSVKLNWFKIFKKWAKHLYALRSKNIGFSFTTFLFIYLINKIYIPKFGINEDITSFIYLI